MSATRPLEIQVFSDPICPWCYIGFHNLVTAIRSYPRTLPPLVMVWRTFMLNPEMPDEGMERDAYLARKFGGATGARSVYDRIAQAGANAGLAMRLDAIRTTPQTRWAHQIVQAFQADPDLNPQTTNFVHALFVAYFDQGQDIGSRDVLDALARDAGAPPGLVDQALTSGAVAQSVVDDDANNRARGLRGVPGYLIDREHFMGGAQPAIAFHRLFDLALLDVASDL